MSSPLLMGILRAAQGGTGQGVPTAGSLLYGDGSGWSSLAAGTRGDTLLYGIGGATAPSWGRHELIVPMQCAPDANNIWADMPAAETFYQGTLNSITKINLALYTQARLILLKRGVAGFAGSILYAKYHTSFATAVGTYSALGTSAVSVPLDTGDACADSGWIDLAAGAIADNIFLCLAGSGGDGIVDPHFGNIYLHFR